VAEGVYVSWYWYGSPAAQFGLNATRRITAIDGVAIADLDALLAAVADKADRETAELTTELLDGRTEVLTLRLDLNHWPTFEIRQTDDGWERRAL
jgi:S1-C subfamily serine protease